MYESFDVDGDGSVTVEEIQAVSNVGRIKALADLFGLFYVGMASVVGAYMGMSAWMSKKK